MFQKASKGRWQETALLNSSASKFASMPEAAQWAFLAAGACAALLHLAGLPAAFFLGPMAAGVIMGVNGASIRDPGL